MSEVAECDGSDGSDGGGGSKEDAPGGDSETATTDDDEYAVDLRHRGETVTVAVGADEPVLDAAEAAGLDLPYSCRQGQCTSCVGRVVDGALDRSDGSALDPMQEDDGFALLCVATPESDCTVETETQDDLFGGDLL